jgi:hypothetical protein
MTACGSDNSAKLSMPAANGESACANSRDFVFRNQFLTQQQTLKTPFSLSVSSVSSDCVASASPSLPTEWRLRSRLWMEYILLRKRDVEETELALLAETLDG